MTDGNDDPDSVQAIPKCELGSARDVIEALIVVLTFCRHHADHCADLIQSVEQRSALAKISNRVRDRLTTTFITAGQRRFLCDVLDSHDPVLGARAVAMGINHFVHGLGYSTYREMLAGRGVRELVDLAPYPTTPHDLKSIYGRTDGFSSQPRDGGSILAVDSVTGLALWNGAAHQPLQVVYDPIAGAALDEALDEHVSALVLSPNQRLSDDFTVGGSDQGFFPVSVNDAVRQEQILVWGLDYCSENEVEILLLPELSATEGFPPVIDGKTLGTHASDVIFPSLIIAGSRHLVDPATSLRRNQLSVFYPRSGHRVDHDKVGKFVVGSTEVNSTDSWSANQAGEEAIDRGKSIRIHAGTRWSMIPLICADFLDQRVIGAVADLAPVLILVVAMTAKTQGFEQSAGRAIAAGQSTVVVANGPVDWTSGDTPSDDRSVHALAAMPLADTARTTLRVVPSVESKPPYAAVFRSAHADIEVVYGVDVSGSGRTSDSQAQVM